MASEHTPCAACKFLRRKCYLDCILAPYFPIDQTQKFINLHRVYGTANVKKLLAELPVHQRQDAVNSLAHEAEARLQDPVYGCTRPIVLLHHRIQNMKGVLQDAYKELAAYQDAVLKAQEAMGGAGFPVAQPTPDMMQPLGVNPLSASSSSEPYKTASMMGIPTRGCSLEIHEPGPQTNNNNATIDPEQHFMPAATFGTEQLQEIIRDFELQQLGQDIRFDRGQGFDVRTGSNSGVGVVGFSLNDPGQQSNNNNNTLHPGQLVMPIATVSSEQQETIRPFELEQHVQDIWFDGGPGFDAGTGSNSGVGVVGFSLNDSCPQSNNNNTLHPEQHVVPIATVGTEQQETIRAFELQQQGQDIGFDWGRGFDVGTGSSGQPEQLVMPIATVGSEQQASIRPIELHQHGQGIGFDGGQGFDVGTGSRSGIGFDWGQGFNVGSGSSTAVGVVGYSLNNPGPQSNNNNNTMLPEQFIMPTATIGTEQQEIIRAFEMQQHGQDNRFDWGRGFNFGTGSSNGVGVVGSSLNDPCPQSNNNNNTLHPEQLVVPIATIGTEQQETIRPFELHQQGQDIWFDGGRGFDVGSGSSTGVGVVGFSLNHPDPQSSNQNNTFVPEPPFMPTATDGTERLQEIIRDFELQLHGQDFMFERGQGFDVGTGSSSGAGAVGFSLNDPSRQSSKNNNALQPEQLVMPTATVGSERQETIRPFELQQHEQDIWFDGCPGFDAGTGSSSGVGVVGFSINDPCPQSNNKNNTLHPRQVVMPIATVVTEQQETNRASELQQQGQVIWFDGDRGFDVGSGSSTGVGVVGFSLNDPGAQSNNQNNTFVPEPPFTPTATVGTERLQEIIRDFELQLHGQDIRLERGQGFDVGTGSSSGAGVVGFSLSDPGPQSSTNNNALHPEQLVMPITTVGSEQQETIRPFELQQHEQDIRFDGGPGFVGGNGSSSGVGIVGFSLNDPCPQSNNNNNTLHPEQLVVPTASVGTEQQETIRSFELQQQGQYIWFNGGRGFNVGTGSCTGVGVVGFSLNHPGLQSNNNNVTWHPEQPVMPIATVGSEQQETIRAFELQQHGQDIRFDGGHVFNVGAGSSTGVGVIGFSLNNPPSSLQVSPHPMMGNFESEFIHPHFQPQLSFQSQQVVAVQEHHTRELESLEEWLQGQNVGSDEAETGSSFYYVNR